MGRGDGATHNEMAENVMRPDMGNVSGIVAYTEKLGGIQFQGHRSFLDLITPSVEDRILKLNSRQVLAETVVTIIFAINVTKFIPHFPFYIKLL